MKYVTLVHPGLDAIVTRPNRKHMVRHAARPHLISKVAYPPDRRFGYNASGLRGQPMIDSQTEPSIQYTSLIRL